MTNWLSFFLSVALSLPIFGGREPYCPDCERPTQPPPATKHVSRSLDSAPPLNVLKGKPYTSICRVSSRNSGTLVSCSGTLIGRGESGGLILTAAHCVPRGAKRMFAQWDYQDKVVHQGDLLAIDRDADLAVFVVPDPPCGAVELAEPSAQSGPFTAVGFPGVGRGKMYFVQGDYLGISKSGKLTIEHSIAPGFSGGPIFDRKGRLVSLGNFRSTGGRRTSSGPSYVQIAEFLEPFVSEEAMCALFKRFRERRRGGGGGFRGGGGGGDITPISPDNAPKFDIDLGGGGGDVPPETEPTEPEQPPAPPQTPPEDTPPATVNIGTADLEQQIKQLAQQIVTIQNTPGSAGPSGPRGPPGPPGPAADSPDLTAISNRLTQIEQRLTALENRTISLEVYQDGKLVGSSTGKHTVRLDMTGLTKKVGD
jgi:hypothetical protein